MTTTAQLTYPSRSGGCTRIGSAGARICRRDSARAPGADGPVMPDITNGVAAPALPPVRWVRAGAAARAGTSSSSPCCRKAPASLCATPGTRRTGVRSTLATRLNTSLFIWLWLDGRSLRDVSRLSGGRSTQPEPVILHGLKPKRRGTWVGNGHSHR